MRIALAVLGALTLSGCGALTEAGADAANVIETAIEAYVITFGAPPAAEADLVTSEMLRAEFTDFDLAADGAIVAVPGSICP